MWGTAIFICFAEFGSASFILLKILEYQTDYYIKVEMYWEIRVAFLNHFYRLILTIYLWNLPTQ